MRSRSFSDAIADRLKQVEDERASIEAFREKAAVNTVNVYRDTRDTTGPVLEMLRARNRRYFVGLLVFIGVVPLRVLFGLPLEICLTISAVLGFFYWRHIERRYRRSKLLPKLRHYD
ncbi:hypothetical protein [Ensifer sp.]|uniref:hypothetical protein n=1 Tax=Ensifer sp. TaxID=1872086 RepID=UPI00289B4D24|nr:hypothetical protein [Ensifer sp.]